MVTTWVYPKGTMLQPYRPRYDGRLVPVRAREGVTVFADDFDPVAALAQEDCHRCKARGLVPATQDDRDSAKPEDRAQEWCTVSPSTAAKCPACGLVGEWPAMCMEPEHPKPKWDITKLGTTV